MSSAWRVASHPYGMKSCCWSMRNLQCSIGLIRFYVADTHAWTSSQKCILGLQKPRLSRESAFSYLLEMTCRAMSMSQNIDQPPWKCIYIVETLTPMGNVFSFSVTEEAETFHYRLGDMGLCFFIRWRSFWTNQCKTMLVGERHCIPLSGCR